MKNVVIIGETKYPAKMPENVLEKIWGMRFKNEGKMVFQPARGQILDTFFVREPLNLYFIRDDRIVKQNTVRPNSFKTITTKTDYLIESVEDLDLAKDTDIRIKTG